MIDWTYRAPRGDAANTFIDAYERGVQARREEKRRSVLDTYGIDAAHGNRDAIARIAAEAPDLATQFATLPDRMDEHDRRKSVETWDWIGTILQRPDGAPITTAEELARAKTLAKVRGLPAEMVDNVGLADVPKYLQLSETARSAIASISW